MLFAYIIRRVLYIIPITLGVSLIVFILFNVVGGSPVLYLLGQHANAETIRQLEHELGFDKPLWINPNVHAQRTEIPLTEKEIAYLRSEDPRHHVERLQQLENFTYCDAEISQDSLNLTGKPTDKYTTVYPATAKMMDYLGESEPGDKQTNLDIFAEKSFCEFTPRGDGLHIFGKFKFLPFAWESLELLKQQIETGQISGEQSEADTSAESVVNRGKTIAQRFDYDRSFQSRPLEGYSDDLALATEMIELLKERELPDPEALSSGSSSSEEDEDAAMRVVNINRIYGEAVRHVRERVTEEGFQHDFATTSVFSPGLFFDSQFFNYLFSLARFDFGDSYKTRTPVGRIILNGIGPSLSVVLPPFIFAQIISIFVAMSCAYARNTMWDRGMVLFSVMGMSIPMLAFIIFGQFYLANYYKLFPVQGFEGSVLALKSLDDVRIMLLGFIPLQINLDWLKIPAVYVPSFKYFVLSWIIWSLVTLGSNVRFYRTVVLDEINQDYVRTAKAKGLNVNRVMIKHVLRNSLIPILTRVVIILPFLYTGSLLLERFFAIPGLGDAMISALNESDFPVIKAMTMIGAIGFILANLLTDICYTMVDPRVKLQ
jgi:peptide/nickel transport system permease protein